MDRDFLLEQLGQTETKSSSKPTRKRVKVKKQKPLWREYIEVVVVSLAAAIFLRLLVVSAYRVDSSSMEQTLYEGDYIFVNKLTYKFASPANGDVIVFSNPLEPNKEFIKRIIAGPGQMVEIIDKVVYIDNMLAEIVPNAVNYDPKIMPAQLSMRDNFGPIQVPEGQYFVLGDNRDFSQDSRHWGFVPAGNIDGKALFVYWSWEPDDSSPEWQFPYIHSFFQMGFYFLTNFPSQTRWDRLFTAL